MAGYAFGKRVEMGFDEAVERVTAALGTEGFGVLSDIDVSATLKKKLGREMPRYRILGACNPQAASRALDADPRIGLLLPCNVVVREDAAGDVYVDFMDPASVLKLVDRPEVDALGGEVRERLQRAMAAL